jgi:hypothetical protein
LKELFAPRDIQLRPKGAKKADASKAQEVIMLRYLAIPLAAAGLLVFSAQDPVWAAGKKSGFSRDSGQGNSSNDNTNANPNNQGKTSVSGPKGQIDKGNFDCNNCEQDLPGKNR